MTRIIGGSRAAIKKLPTSKQELGRLVVIVISHIRRVTNSVFLRRKLGHRGREELQDLTRTHELCFHNS